MYLWVMSFAREIQESSHRYPQVASVSLAASPPASPRTRSQSKKAKIESNDHANGFGVGKGEQSHPPEEQAPIPPVFQPPATSKSDTKLPLTRASFTVGVLNACGTCFILGAHPTLFYRWYSPKCITLILLRWIDFRR